MEIFNAGKGEVFASKNEADVCSREKDMYFHKEINSNDLVLTKKINTSSFFYLSERKRKRRRKHSVQTKFSFINYVTDADASLTHVYFLIKKKLQV